MHNYDSSIKIDENEMSKLSAKSNERDDANSFVSKNQGFVNLQQDLKIIPGFVTGNLQNYPKKNSPQGNIH